MADRTSSPLSKLPRLPRFRRKFRMRAPGSITALEIDGSVLRVVQTAQRINRAAVTRVAVAPLEFAAGADAADPVAMGKAVAKALHGLRIKPGMVVMGVPRAQVVLRSLTLPVINDVRELASMVHLQVGKDLPFTLEEAVIDFKIDRRISAPEAAPPPGAAAPDEASAGEAAALTPKIEVLVAATKAEVVDFYRRVAGAAGVQLASLGWISYANARCLEACRVAEDQEVVALVSLRPEEMSIDVVARQRLLFSRGTVAKQPAPQADEADGAPGETAATPAPAAPEAGPAAYVDMVVIEAVRSLHSYGGMDPHSSAAKVVIAGSTGQEEAVAEALRKRLNLPCAVLDLVQALDLPAAAREHSAGALAAIGLALGAQDSQGLPFDFLNPKRPAVQRNLQRIRLAMGVAAGLAILVFAFGLQTHYKRQREADFNKVKAELDAAAKMRTSYNRMRRQAGTIQTWNAEGKNWLEHLAYLSAILPPAEEVYLTSISIGAQGTIKLAVQARSGGILAKLEKQVRAAGYEVRPLAITPGTDRTGYNFRSNIELIPPAKMKIDVALAHPPARPEDDVSLEGAKGGRKGGARE